MDYYNKIDEAYLTELQNPMRKLKFKVEILSHYEGAIGQITNDLSSAEVGSISINKEQGCRRSCSFTIIDRDEKYLPQVDSWFWYNRKFKLFIGVVVSNDTYWFPQGVFITKSATAHGKTLAIEGIDKYGFLNGELNARMCLVEYQASVTNSKKGTKIADLIRDTLMLDLGNNIPLDPVEPLIDPIFYDAELYDDIVVDEGGYLGEIFDKLAEMYGANIYYDVNGRLRMERVFNYNLPSWYRHLSPQFDFGVTNITETDIDVQYDYDGVNIVTVATDNTEGKICSYTAKNENPQSPVCISSVGYKGLDGGTYYIPLGDTSIESGEEKCRQQAEYMLLQNTCMSATINFNYPIIPHLDVDNTINLTNDYYNFKQQLFIIQSITLPLSNGEMSVGASNIQWLPLDTNCMSLHCTTSDAAIVVKYDTNGGTDINGKSLSYDNVSSVPQGIIVLKGNNLYNGTKLLTWVDSFGTQADYDEQYIVPNADTTLTANWIKGSKITFTTTTTGNQVVKFQSLSASKSLIKFDDSEIRRSNQKIIKQYNKAYSSGTHSTIVVSENANLTNLAKAYDKTITTKIDCSELPHTKWSEPLVNDSTALQEFIFPKQLATLDANNGVLSQCKKISAITFPTTNCTVSNINGFLKGSKFSGNLTIPNTITFFTKETDNVILNGTTVVGDLKLNCNQSGSACTVNISAGTTSIDLAPKSLTMCKTGLVGDLSTVKTIGVLWTVNFENTDGFMSNTAANVTLHLLFSNGKVNKIPKNAFNGYTGTNIGLGYYNATSTSQMVLMEGAFSNMPNISSLPNIKYCKIIPDTCLNNLPKVTTMTIANEFAEIYGCNNLNKLKTLIIGDTVIKVNGFNNCSNITSVKIGKQVAEIQGFKQSVVSNFSVGSDNEHFEYSSGCLYKDGITLCRTNNYSSFTVKEGIVNIQSYAIQGNLSTLNLPSSLKSFDEYAITSSKIKVICFGGNYNRDLGRYDYNIVSGLETLDNVSVDTIMAYGNGVKDIASADCLAIRKYCINHNINYVELNELENVSSHGGVTRAGKAELRGNE